MSELNAFIDTSRRFTAPPDGIPTPDRSQQVNVGLEIAQRAAQQHQQTPPAPTAMLPITPVAN